MTIISNNPREYGLDHDAFRPSQYNAIQQVVLKAENFPDKKNFTIIEAPTGTGKSAIATTLAAFDRVTVLVGTLNLLDQYVNEYDFKGIKGRQNYKCAHPDKISKWKKENRDAPTAGDCHYPKMHECPAAEFCQYLEVKQAALASRKLVVTYAYASLSERVKDRGGYLVMDEGHLAAEHILHLAQFSISRVEQGARDYKPFPKDLWLYGEKKKGGILTEAAERSVITYLRSCQKKLDDRMQYMSALEPEFAKLNKRFEQIERMIFNLGRSEWFLDCHAYVSRSKGQDVAGLRLRALDARTVAGRLWSEKKNIVLMSATIGNPKPLMDKLGVDMFEFYSYPHPVPISNRPVDNLRVRRMTHKNLTKFPNLYRAQAMAIVNWIESLDPDFRGIVLTSSYKKILEIEKVFKVFLPSRRLIVQKGGMSIDKISRQFITDVKAGDILVASIQGFGQGINLKGDLARFSVIAGLPHENPTDPYAQAMKGQAGGANYIWSKVYSAVPQAAGRVSRASRVNGEYLTNYTAIADGSATSPLALKFYPKYFIEALEGNCEKEI